MSRRMVDLLPSSLSIDPAMLASAEMLDAEFERIETMVSLVAPWQSLEQLTEPALSCLAAECAVDVWSADWSDARKRAVLEAALLLHRKKGTPRAVTDGLEVLGYRARHVNWPEFGGVPFTFRVEVDVLEEGVREETYAVINQVIDDNKALRSHLDGLAVFLSSEGDARVCGALQCGQAIDVYPWQPEDVVLESDIRCGAAVAIYNVTDVGV